MGTVIALLLVLSTLTGCAGETLTNLKNAPPILAETPSLLSYQTEVQLFEETIRSQDGSVLGECSYKVPVLRVLLPDGTVLDQAASPEEQHALALAEAFNAQFSQWTNPSQNMADLQADAEDEWAFRRESNLLFEPYSDHLDCTVYQTRQLISVSGVYRSFTGGAHSNTILLSWNFDLETGEFFQPSILDEDNNFQDYVQRSLVRQAQEAAAKNDMSVEEYYWIDYAATLADWSNYAVSFDETGMTVGFSPYELACYAAGPQVFHLPYEQISPHLGTHGKALLGLEQPS